MPCKDHCSDRYFGHSFCKRANSTYSKCIYPSIKIPIQHPVAMSVRASSAASNDPERRRRWPLRHNTYTTSFLSCIQHAPELTLNEGGGWGDGAKLGDCTMR